MKHISPKLLLLCAIVGIANGAAPPAPSETPRTPDESAKMFQVHNDDLVWEQVLAEPLVAQPVHMNFDERGRLWVVQYRQYPYPEGLKVLSRDKFWRVQYDKVPKAPPHNERGRDKITIHEDTNGDGKFDKHKTFVDGLNLASAVEIGRGGVWVLNPPYLLFYPDKNRDDVPDGDPEVRLSGFGISDSHSVVNSLKWGPDGWLYGAQGSTVHGQVVVHQADGKPSKHPPVHSMGQLIWRYHPTARTYEIFAEGGGNAFGLEIDSKGRIFSGHNGADTRGFHFLQRGYYRKGFSKHGPLSNPYSFGYFEAMASHKVPRFTHAFVIYEGGALPGKYHGQLFGVEPLQSQIVLANLQRNGSSFKTDDINRPVTSDDKWFRPVDIKVGPDGAIYVADFYERYPSHREHYDGMVYNENGRIYRLRAKDHVFKKPPNLAEMNEELSDKLLDKNRTIRQLALRVLADRGENEKAASDAKASLASNRGRVDHLWALNLVGDKPAPQALTAYIDHRLPHVRSWAVRLLCDREVPDGIAKQLAAKATTEENVEVRTQLAASARRLPASRGLPIVRELLQRDEDVNDVFQPLLTWWAIEGKCESDPDAVVELFASSALWDEPMVKTHVTQRLMRRFAATGKRSDLAYCSRLFELAPTDAHRQQLLKGFEEAYAGRSLAGLPQKLSQQINDLGGGSLALRVRGGDAAALKEALQLITDEKADANLRRDLIEVLAEIELSAADQESAIETLSGVAKSSQQVKLRCSALTTLQTFRQPDIARVALEQYIASETPADVRESALELLVSRDQWAAQLLKAVDDKRIPADAITLPTLRKILLHENADNAALVKRHWGDISGATTEAMRTQVKELSTLLTEGSGDPYAGKKTYLTACAKCHRLFEEGADIGPNLTSYQRDNLEAMLLNIVNPSAEVREGFETYNIYTDDGRVLAGFLADQDEHVVVVRTADGQRHSLPRDEIDEMDPSPLSIMPEGLLAPLDQQQIRDLFAYLRSRQPLND